MFGLVQSPFILGGTLDAHLESKKGDNINEIAETKKVCMSMIDERLKQLKLIFLEKHNLILHKWHSNVPEIKDDNNSEEIQIYTKAQLGVEDNKTKILGLTWD